MGATACATANGASEGGDGSGMAGIRSASTLLTARHQEMLSLDHAQGRCYLALGVLSHPLNVHRRDVVRKTWGGNILGQDIVLRFVLGTHDESGNSTWSQARCQTALGLLTAMLLRLQPCLGSPPWQTFYDADGGAMLLA
eukprot:6182918-Pleurochrysis_carterae.AAC.2